MFPLDSLTSDSGPVALAVAMCLGLAFGWCLEQGGMGSAPKLAGQFYRTDFAVAKLMMSAILTAMLGLFWFGRLGLVDIDRLAVPETYLLPQAVGGALFGLGFVTAGLCPGTSCVAAASGRGDGVAVIAGLLVGVLSFHEGFALLRPLYDATPRGPETLPSVLHVPYGPAVFAVIVVALAALGTADRLQRATGPAVAEPPLA